MAALSTLSSLLPRTLSRWLDSTPHPALAFEIAPDHVAVCRGWQVAYEALPEGTVLPSTVELNLPDPGVVRGRLQSALNRIGGRGPDVALLLPDQAIRLFLLHFDTFPRRNDEVIPLLRWRLRKSVPFEIEETIVSYMPQALAPGQAGGVSVLAAVARQKVVRQFEEIAEALNLRPGVVLSSTLAALPLLRSDRPALLARVSGRTLTTIIVRGETICVSRCTDVPADASRVEPGSILEEVYPAIAFFQDMWRENVAEIRLAGFGARADEFRRALESELSTPAAPLLSAALPGIPTEGRPFVDKQLDALAGWTAGGGG